LNFVRLAINFEINYWLICFELGIMKNDMKFYMVNSDVGPSLLLVRDRIYLNEEAIKLACGGSVVLPMPP
jgi:hypothetical protein